MNNNVHETANEDFEGKKDLAELLDTVHGYDDAQKDAFLLLGQVYKSGKRVGYRVGYNAAMSEFNETTK